MSPPRTVFIISLYEFLPQTNKKTQYILLVLLGVFGAIINGLVFPALALVYSQSFSTIATAAGQSTNDGAQILINLVITFVIVGAVAFVAGSIQTFCFEFVSTAMTEELRRRWFEALLHQDISYFDLHPSTAGLPTLISDSCALFRAGTGRKFGEGVQFTVTAIGGIAVAFYSEWRVTLISFGVIPIMAVAGYWLVKVNSTGKKQASIDYSIAGGVAFITLSRIKTVLSLNCLTYFISNYKTATNHAREAGISRGFKSGFANGFLLASFMLMYIVFSLYGTFLLYSQVSDNGCDPSGAVGSPAVTCAPSAANLFAALFGVIFAGQGLAQVGTSLQDVAAAMIAIEPALAVIYNAVEIDVSAGSDSNEKSDGEEDKEMKTNDDLFLTTSPSRSNSPSSFLPSQSTVIRPLPQVDFTDMFSVSSDSPIIEFDQVNFAYPTRDVKVLSDLSFSIKPGEKIAFIGGSGCGKSTIAQLIMRFYDPLSGSVKFCGTDLKDFDVHELRKKFAFVSQEPVLFPGTIADNIRNGRLDCSEDDIKTAAINANAHDFIMQFKSKYDTQVGIGGSLLSGGQKQRVAISRALVGAPMVFIFDEATSALDSANEALVQSALDKIIAETSSATITIAHRLTTIKDVDKIIVMERGEIVETGNHSELMRRRGQYYDLYTLQNKPLDQAETIVATSISQDVKGLAYVSKNSGMSDVRLSQIPRLELSNIKFAYPTRLGNQVLKDLSLCVYPGEKIGIVGQSGSGKSSVFSLLNKFYNPDEGSVSIDGAPLLDIPPFKLHTKIAMVGQEPEIFNMSIRENIKLGYPSATDDEVVEAAKLANAHNYIMVLPDAYDTQIGETSTLSGGQKQRLCIARALVRKPQILLLDEATSALDAESEKIVQAALNDLFSSSSMRELTVLIISHHLSALRDCDKIAVVDNGRVAEFGPEAELLEMGGRFAALASAAFSDPQGDDGERDAVIPEVVLEEQEDDEVSLSGKELRAVAYSLLRRVDTKWIILTVVGAILAGLVFPFWGILLALTIELIYRPVVECPSVRVPIEFNTCQEYWDSEADDLRERSYLLALYWAILICVVLIGYVMLLGSGGVLAESLSYRLRNSAFVKLVSFEVAYHDKNKVEDECTNLSEDASTIQLFTLSPVSGLLQSSASIITGVTVSLIFMWPIALIALACLPIFVLVSGEDSGRMKGTRKGLKIKAEAGSLLAQSLSNVRTVYALDLQNKLLTDYVIASRTEDWKSNLKSALMFGAAMFLQQLLNALLFWTGGTLLINYPDTFEFRDFLVAMFSILFGLIGFVTALQNLSGRGKAKKAARRVLSLLQRESKINPLEGVDISQYVA